MKKVYEYKARKILHEDDIWYRESDVDNMLEEAYAAGVEQGRHEAQAELYFAEPKKVYIPWSTHTPWVEVEA